MTLTDLGPKPKNKTGPKLKVIFGGSTGNIPNWTVISDITHVNFLSCDNGITVM